MGIIDLGHFKVTKVPQGEAPLWVREAWVGLTLPCGPVCGHLLDPEKGVRSGNQLSGSREVMPIPQKAALDILAEKDPKAAAWFRENCHLKDDAFLLFGMDEGEDVPGPGGKAVTIWDDMETGTMRPAR
jgi:hypothetical protein